MKVATKNNKIGKSKAKVNPKEKISEKIEVSSGGKKLAKKNSEQKTMKNLDSKSKTVLKKNTANKKSSGKPSEMKSTNLAASPEKSPKTQIKRKSNENLSGEKKKQKLHTELSVLSNSQHVNNDQVKVTFSFPLEGLNINRKETLQQILKHCDSIENPGNILSYSEEEESLKKTFNNLKDLKFGNRNLFLRYIRLPSRNSSELVKKVLLLPTKHVSKLDDIKKYYNAVSVEKVVELDGQNLYFLFLSKTEAENAVKKEGYSLGGFVVTLKDCENEAEKESKKNQKGNIKKEENKNSNDSGGEEEEEEEEDIGDDEEDEDEEEDEDGNEEMENDDDDDDDDNDDDDDDEEEEEEEEE